VTRYDATGRLLGTSRPGVADESFDLDALGNRAGEDVSAGGNEVSEDATYTYQYDDEGNRTKRTLKATGAYETYAWDHRNRLTSVTSFTASDAEQRKVRFWYDASDRRISKRQDAPAALGGTYVEHYAHDGGDLALVFDQGRQLKHRYLHDGMGGAPLAEEDGPAYRTPGQDARTAFRWLLTGPDGSVRDVLNGDGAAVPGVGTAHHAYAAFGAKAPSSLDASFGNPTLGRFGFHGMQFDRETGLYAAGVRY